MGIAETNESREALAQALKLHAAGRLDDAAAAYEALLRISTADVEAATQLGVVRLQQQRTDDALALLDRALALDDRAAAAHAWRGEALRRRQALPQAIASFRRAIELEPRFAPALFNLALAQAELGDRDAARDAWQRFAMLRPADTRVHAELGRLAFAHGDYAEAASAFARQLERTPGTSTAVCDLASALLRVPDLPSARRVLEPFVAVHPRDARALRVLAQVVEAEGDRECALRIVEGAAALDPGDVETALHRAGILDRLARLEEAIDGFGRAAALAPRRADIRNAAAVAWLNLGEADEALREYRAALELDPAYHQVHSNLLLALHHVDPPVPHAIYGEHLRWAAQHAAFDERPRGAFDNERDAGRPLSIGYLSPRFGAGPLEQFLLPVLAAHDRDRVRVTCYATSTMRDPSTDRFCAQAAAWRDVERLSDDALVERVREDGIDILVDLVGHCPGNRLRAMARRAAPVQMTWLDYVDTTGLRAIDYLLTDLVHSPRGDEQFCTERLLRLPDSRFCYGPAQPLPDLHPPEPGRPFSFGCFNRLSKLGESVFALWSLILLRVPHSQLRLKASAFQSQSTCERIRDRFEARGVARSRIDLRPFTSVPQMMREYGDVDVVLDPFPYNAATTTCDALAMGVPTVTLAGETMAGRQGASIMTACGLADGIAATRDAYVELAVRAAEGGVRDAPARRELRDRFLASPLCDAPRFARALEDRYREAWRGWCDRG